LGGADFDREIITDLGRRFASCADLLRGPATDIEILRRRIQLGESAEEIKVQLSVTTTYSAYLSELTPPVEAQCTRERLTDLIGPLLEETLVSCEQTLRTVGLGWADIARIIPVGGSTRLPMIGELLSSRSGRPVLTVDEPELAVARGAALLALESLLTSDAPSEPADIGAADAANSAIDTSSGVGAAGNGSRAARLGVIARRAARRAVDARTVPSSRPGIDPAVLAKIIAQARRRRGK
jgi:molecular chaperone DnaK (HSP70)